MKMYQILLVLGLLFAACSRKTDVDLFNEGKEAQEKGNFQLAVERYEEIVTRFEKTAYAESALYRAGLVYNNDLHDIPKAVAAYRKFFDLYSQNKQAPTALFLAGYQIFLEKYPSHELATSARFELETLGKDPSSLLRIDTVAAGDAGSPPPARKSGPERRTKRKASH
ncbi:MAG: tetratricopeptide repeat protein [Ignavibacteria bacterium]|nr:MAG: tetratricopeptide repeat protein [Ignavibacteria bacterium]